MFLGWQISWIHASHDWNTMAKTRQNEFDGDPGGDGQIVETGKERYLKKIVQ